MSPPQRIHPASPTRERAPVAVLDVQETFRSSDA